MSKTTCLNAAELGRLVKAQKQRILDVLNERDEARQIARQLLFELRTHIDTPVTHASYHWLKDTKPITEERQ